MSKFLSEIRDIALRNSKGVITLLIGGIIALLLGYIITDANSSNVFLGVGVELLSTILILVIIERRLTAMPIGRGQLAHQRIRMEYLEYFEYVKHAKTVKILETWINAVVKEAYAKPFRSVLIEAATRNDAQVRILICHPDSDAAKRRAQQLADKPVAANIRDNIRILYAWKLEIDNMIRENPAIAGSLEVRLYMGDVPQNTIFAWDDNMYTTSFPNETEADSSPHLIFPSGSSFAQERDKVFTDLWKHTQRTIEEYTCMKVTLGNHNQRSYYLHYIRDPRDITVYYLTHPFDMDWVASFNDGAVLSVSTNGGEDQEATGIFVADVETKIEMIRKINENYGYPVANSRNVLRVTLS